METYTSSERMFLLKKTNFISRIVAFILVLTISASTVCFYTQAADADFAGFEKACAAAWKNHEKTIDVSKYGIEISQVESAFNRAFFDNLDCYYLTSNFAFSYTGKLIKSITFVYEQCTEAQTAALNAEIHKVLNILSTFKSDIDKVVFLHEYLTENTEFDISQTKRTIYDCLVGGSCVCEGYAKTFMLLMNRAGIECKYVSSDENQHAWNIVKIGGSYYFVDVTWDDTLAVHDNVLCSEYKLVETGHLNSTRDWVINRAESCMGKCTSRKYDDAFFSKAMFSMSYSGGKWYYSDGTDICVGSTADLSEKLLKTVDDKWFLWDDEMYYYVLGYSDAVILNDRIFYNTHDTVRSMKTDGTDDKLVYILSAEENAKGRIYDMSADSSGVKYHLKKSPNKSDTEVYTAALKNLEHIHSFSRLVTKPTCTEKGYTDFICLCGYSYRGNYTEKAAHTSVTDKAVKATFSSDGKTSGSHCKVCGKTITAQNKIYKVSSAKLSKTSFTANGKAQKPSVTVVDSKGNKLKNSVDYTVKYSNSKSKNPGKYTVVITLKGKYSGQKTLTYTISPAQVKGLSLSSKAKKSVKISFSKLSGSSGYEIYYSTKKTSGFSKLKAVTKTPYTYSKLKSGKTYYFKVRAYKTCDGKKLYGKFSAVGKVKIK